MRDVTTPRKKTAVNNPSQPPSAAVTPSRNIAPDVWRVHAASLSICLLAVVTHVVPFVGLPLVGAPNYVTSSVWVLFSALYINTAARVAQGSLKTARYALRAAVLFAASSATSAVFLNSSRSATTNVLLAVVQLVLFCVLGRLQLQLLKHLTQCASGSAQSVVYPVSKHKGYMVTASVFFVLFSGLVASLHLI